MRENSKSHDYGPGDTFCTHKREVASSTGFEAVGKIFHIHDPDAEEFAHEAA